MKLTITTGLRYADEFPGEVTVRSFTVDVPDHEFDPETVWQAGNRIDSLEGDLARLALPWQRDVRLALDTHQSPSLSVGDTLTITSDSGTPLVGYRCDSRGWTAIAPEAAAR